MAALAGVLLVACAGCGTSSALLWGTNPETAYGCYESKHAPLPSRSASVAEMDSLPVPVRDPEPEVPSYALAADAQGVVVVRALVCEHGRVLDTYVTQSIPLLDAAAVDAVRRMWFHPARLRGQAVACWVPVPVAFGPY